MRALVPLSRLLQPRTRAAELIQLDRRVRAERDAAIDDAERALALAVRAAKLAVAAAVPHAAACGGCATALPWPMGQHAGGACCAGVTADIFDDAELAALAHAGTRSTDLAPPPRRDPHAGCGFRGATGCALATVHRPARCVHYTCAGLRAELHRRGQLDEVEGLLTALDDAMRAYRIAYRARQDREVVGPIVAALADHQASSRR